MTDEFDPQDMFAKRQQARQTKLDKQIELAKLLDQKRLDARESMKKCIKQRIAMWSKTNMKRPLKIKLEKSFVPPDYIKGHEQYWHLFQEGEEACKVCKEAAGIVTYTHELTIDIVPKI